MRMMRLTIQDRCVVELSESPVILKDSRANAGPPERSQPCRSRPIERSQQRITRMGRESETTESFGRDRRRNPDGGPRADVARRGETETSRRDALLEVVASRVVLSAKRCGQGRWNAKRPPSGDGGLSCNPTVREFRYRQNKWSGTDALRKRH